MWFEHSSFRVRCPEKPSAGHVAEDELAAATCEPKFAQTGAIKKTGHLGAPLAKRKSEDPTNPISNLGK